MKNIDLKKIATKIKLQKSEGDKIVKKRRGRPKIAPKIRMEIRMDSILRSKLNAYDDKNGNKGTSVIITRLVKDFLTNEGYY